MARTTYIDGGGKVQYFNKLVDADSFAKNGKFSYSGKSFSVYVISYSYPWNLEVKGSSQGRQGQAVYPFRRSQGDINVTLQFASVEEMRKFANWCRAYHLKVTSYSGLVVNGTGPNMHFKLSIPERGFKWGSGTVSYNARTFEYDVLMPSIPYVQSNESVAPTMRLTLRIIGGGDFESTTKSSWSSGDITSSIAQNMVNPSSVSSKGDGAYQK